MITLNPYLTFNGNAEQALSKYATIFKGEIKGLNRYKDAPGSEALSDEQQNRVLHAEFHADGVFFMVSDNHPTYPETHAGNISMSLNFDNIPEQQAVYDQLVDGGQAVMPLQDQFWGARFGMLVDAFGVAWMLNCDAQQ